MSIVKNEPQYKNGLLQAIRTQLEHRAFWLYPLCDIAMCCDHGIGRCYGAVLDLPKCIAKGDDVCALRYHKKYADLRGLTFFVRPLPDSCGRFSAWRKMWHKLAFWLTKTQYNVKIIYN